MRGRHAWAHKQGGGLGVLPGAWPGERQPAVRRWVATWTRGSGVRRPPCPTHPIARATTHRTNTLPAPAAGGDGGRAHAPLLLAAPRRRLLRRLGCAAARGLPSPPRQLARALPPPPPALRCCPMRLPARVCRPRLACAWPITPAALPRLALPVRPLLQRRWWRRRWGWRATQSCMWETTSVSGWGGWQQSMHAQHPCRPRACWLPPAGLGASAWAQPGVCPASSPRPHMRALLPRPSHPPAGTDAALANTRLNRRQHPSCLALG